MYETELYHHGIKGQRWGVRRFQNKDGSLTRLGQKRADKQAKAAAKEEAKRAARGQYSLDSKFEQITGRGKPKLRGGGVGAGIAGLAGAAGMVASVVSGKRAIKSGKPKAYGKAQDMAKNTSDAIYRTTDALSARNAKLASRKASKLDLSNASDQEIREYINRYRLEREFKNLTAEETASGKEKTMAMLDTIGTVAAVGTSVMGAVMAYQQIKNGAFGK